MQNLSRSRGPVPGNVQLLEIARRHAFDGLNQPDNFRSRDWLPESPSLERECGLEGRLDAAEHQVVAVGWIHEDLDFDVEIDEGEVLGTQLLEGAASRSDCFREGLEHLGGNRLSRRA